MLSLGCPFSLLLLLSVMGVFTNPEETCILSLVVPKEKIKSSCSAVENVTRHVSMIEGKIHGYKKDMNALKIMLIREQRLNHENKQILEAEIQKLKEVFQRMMGFKVPKPVEMRENKPLEEPSAAYPSWTQPNRGSYNPRFKDHRNAIPDFPNIVQLYVSRALQNLDSNITSEVDKQLRAYAEGFNEMIKASLSDSHRKSKVQDEEMRADNPAQQNVKTASNWVGIGSQELTVQLQLLNQEIKTITKKYNDLLKTTTKTNQTFSEQGLSLGKENRKLQERVSQLELENTELHQKTIRLASLISNNDASIEYLSAITKTMNRSLKNEAIKVGVMEEELSIQELQLANWSKGFHENLKKMNLTQLNASADLNNKMNSSLFSFNQAMSQFVEKFQIIDSESESMTNMIQSLRDYLCKLKNTSKTHQDFLATKVENIEKGLESKFLNISHELSNAFQAIDDNERSANEYFNNYNASLHQEKTNLLEKIRVLKVTVQLLEEGKQEKEKRDEVRSFVMRYMNKTLTTVASKMESVKNNFKQLQYKVILNSGQWLEYNFTFNTNRLNCVGKQFVRKTKYNNGRLAGVVLCNSFKYKILLSNSLDETFLDVGDLKGLGEDHCEFVGAESETKSIAVSREYFMEQISGFKRRSWGEEPQKGLLGMINPSPKWYECGVAIP